MLRRISVFVILIGAFYMICGCSASFAEDVIFDGDLEVGAGAEITLSPTEDLVSQNTLNKVSVGKSVIGWEDVVEYEKGIAGADPVEAINIDNLWAARINKVMAITQEQYGQAPQLNSALEALTIPAQRPSGNGFYELENSKVSYVTATYNPFAGAGLGLYAGAAAVAEATGATGASGAVGAAAAKAAGIKPLPPDSGVLPGVAPEEEPVKSPDDTTTTPYPYPPLVPSPPP